MATAHVQTKDAQTSSGTTIAVSLTSVAAGNELVASTAAANTAASLQIATSAPSATWANAVAAKANAGGTIAQRMDYSENVASGSWTVTHHDQFTTEITGIVSEVSGTATSSSLGATNSNTGAGVGTIQPGSITPASGSILITSTTDAGGSTSADTIDSSFTVSSDATAWNGANERAGQAYKAAVAASAVNPTWTLPGSADAVALIAEFKAAAGGGPTPGTDSGTLTDSATNIGLGGVTQAATEAETAAVGLGTTDAATLAEQAAIALSQTDPVAFAEQVAIAAATAAQDSAALAEQLQVALFPRQQPYQAAVLADTPVSYWRLGETSGTTAVDVMGVRNGLYNLTGDTLAVAGALASDADTAVSFDGTTNASIALATAAAHNITGGPLSIEAWVKTTSTALQHIFGGYDSVTPNPGFGLIIGVTGVGALDYWDGTGSGVYGWVGGPVVGDGLWHHVVAVASGTTVTFYVDGVASGAYTIIAPSTSYSGQRAIGSRSDLASANSGNWNGQLDEVALYSTALSPTRVLAHYQSGRPSSDTAALTEAIAIALAHQDSAALAELVGIALGSADTAAFAEQVSIAVSVAATDAAALSEATNVNTGNTNPTAADAATLAEQIAIALQATDGAGLAEQMAIALARSDSATLGELVAVAIAIADTAALAEQASIAAAAAAADNAALAEQAAVALGVADPVAVAEQIAIGLQVLDSAALTEQLQVAIAAAATDAGAMADLQAAVAAAVGAADAFHLGEAATVQVGSGTARDWLYVIGTPQAKWTTSAPLAKWLSGPAQQ